MSDDTPTPPKPPETPPPADSPGAAAAPPPPPPGPAADPAADAPPPPPPAGAQPAGPDQTGGATSENRNVMIVLSYLGPLALIPFLTEKQDKEVMWHSRHGLVLLAAEIILSFVLIIGLTLLTIVTGGFGCIGAIFAPILSLALMGLHIVCIAKGLQGQRFVIPELSKYADKF